MSQPLVLSLFPGIGLLDMAFEEEGFCVVRGPDVLWGGDIRRFHPPAGVFDGVIGGPPCQSFTPLTALLQDRRRTPSFGNLIPEFERCVGLTQPHWFVMENVLRAPVPAVAGFIVKHYELNNRWFGADQNRERRFSFGSQQGHPLPLDVALFESPRWIGAVTSAHQGQRWEKKIAAYKPHEAAVAQGLDESFLEHAPFTQQGKLKVIANGVPLPMGRAIARAVKRAMGYAEAVA